VTDHRPEAASPDLWEQHAGWWQDGFTDGVDPEYEEQILPLAAECLRGASRVVDVGTGEGQVARLAVKLGAEVTGVDPTRAQLAVAAERGGGPRYVRAAAESLPFADASFDAAVACLVFEHVPDHELPIAEIARVLEPGGRFVFLLNHPLLQAPNSGWVIDHDLDEQYWRVGSYLPVDITMEELAPGVVLPFVHRPLSQYVNAMANVGLFITRMEEPRPPEGFLAKAKEYRDAADIPRLLLLLAEKLEPA
jgi:SAM-dependent methyltransferase